MNYYERVCATVDLDHISDNVKILYDNMKHPCGMFCVIKSDGYGHGALPIARKLEPFDYVNGFATATAEEALILRRCGIKKPILILGYTFPYAYKELIEEDIALTVFRRDTLFALSQLGKELKKKVRLHVKTDTGMNRIGIIPDEDGKDFVHQIISDDYLYLEGIFTHLATADEADKFNAQKQIKCFEQFVDSVEKDNNYIIPMKHCLNSAGIMDMDSVKMNLARIGIAMYGIRPSDEILQHNITLKPALSLRSHIVYIKELPAGEPVSYGGTFVTKQKTKVATVPVGYGDGYPRGLSNCGYVLIKGKRAPILGRVCMDQFMVDVSAISDVKEGDVVTLIGMDGAEEITVEHLCSLYGGFRYEMICDIGKRVPKEYLEDGIVTYTKDYHDDLK